MQCVWHCCSRWAAYVAAGWTVESLSRDKRGRQTRQTRSHACYSDCGHMARCGGSTVCIQRHQHSCPSEYDTYGATYHDPPPNLSTYPRHGCYDESPHHKVPTAHRPNRGSPIDMFRLALVGCLAPRSRVQCVGKCGNGHAG